MLGSDSDPVVENVDLDRSGLRPEPAQTRRHMVRALLAYVVLPNTGFVILAQFNYAVRPLINLDYIALGLLAPLLGRVVNIAAYAVLVLLDAAATFAPAYHFQLRQIISSARDFLQLNQSATLPLTGLALAAAIAVSWLASAAAGSATGSQRPPTSALLTAGLVFGVLDLLGGTNRYSPSRTATVPINIGTSATFRTLLAIRQDYLQTQRTTDTKSEPAESATSHLLRSGPVQDRIGDIRPTNIALIIVESLGLFTDDKANQLLLAPFRRPEVQSRYRVTFGSIPFQGSTTSAEFRELCGLRMDFGQITPTTKDRCLPTLLARDGFESIAIHGFTRRFFDRQHWYPLLGFEETIFAEDTAFARVPQRCGTVFRGICDVDAAQVVAKMLSRGKPDKRRFVYWVTLNSHLPVDAASAEGSTLDCDTYLDTARYADVCTLMRILQRVHSAIAALASDSSLQPTLFVLAGDHAPPFLSRAKRNLFVADRVPFIELIPTTSRSNDRARHANPKRD